jgi:ribosomal protein S18 acetylase RimI-like enzyme
MDVRVATTADAEAIGPLLHDFNTEFGDVTPGPAKLAERVRDLLDREQITVLVGGSGPDGVAVLSFRPSLWTEALECYLAELYVVPRHRGRGLGRAMLDAAIELARGTGADYICLATSEDDVAARSLYESSGFSHRERDPDGPVMYFYEREL